MARTDGETTRRALASLGALRGDVAIVEDGDRIVLPLTADAEVPAGWGTVEVRDLEPRREDAPGDYRDLLAWSAELRAVAPRAFDIVGDIVLVRIPPELEPRRFELGAALLQFVPGARIVGADHGVQGPERRRSVERVAGTGSWSTRHRENQLEFDVDVEQAYFSPRLAREHALVAEECRAGETVYDLCCGVGPFAITIARLGRVSRVVAVDSNPAAIALLRGTLARYAFAGRVEVVEGRVEEFATARPPVDAVILNLPREGIKYASQVAQLVVPGGRFRYYEVVPRGQAEQRGHMIAAGLPPTGAWSVASHREVHAYSPGADLVSFLFERQRG